jgi:hypothetical protein
LASEKTYVCGQLIKFIVFQQIITFQTIYCKNAALMQYRILKIPPNYFINLPNGSDIAEDMIITVEPTRHNDQLEQYAAT